MYFYNVYDNNIIICIYIRLVMMLNNDIILVLLFSKYSPKNRFAQKMCYAGIEEPDAFLYISPRLATEVGRRGVIILMLLLGQDKTHVCVNFILV